MAADIDLWEREESVASIAEIKERIDLNDLAVYMGLTRPKSGGNYRSPHHDDKSPSLAIFNEGKTFKDHSAGDEAGSFGDCINFVKYLNGCDDAEAIRFLHDYLGLPMTPPEGARESFADKSLAEVIQFKSFHKDHAADLDLAVEYLKGRGISEEVIRKGLQKKTVGFNRYISDRIDPGQPMHGGPAVAFFTKCRLTGRVVAADMRFLDPELNGGLKTQCQGEKEGYLWCIDWAEVLKADTIYVVESPINALSVDVCGLRKTAVVATRGVNALDSHDWSFCQGKKVVICMDNDKPNEKGYSPGHAAGWKLHEILLNQNIAAFLVDQYEWEENDVNDFIKGKVDSDLVTEVDRLRVALRRLDTWLIPGLPGKKELISGKSRLWLPEHDFQKYWMYRPKEDFVTSVVYKTNKEGDEVPESTDICGFRVAGISRVTVASSAATTTGVEDSQPQHLFAITAQTYRHGYDLQRRVVEDEKVHAQSTWEKFGPIYSKPGFFRMINILERTAHIGARKAANFVGVCYREGKLAVNEGPDCYFTEPKKQCPYFNLTFPSGHQRDARPVIDAYNKTFANSAALMLLVWGLGAHLKTVLGFWPHTMIQASKGSGKSVLTKRLEGTIAFKMYSGQSLQTEYRLLTSIGHTSHPVGWEEISARRKDVIDKAVSMLQENYTFTQTGRGADLTEYVLSAPVLLAGEDVPVDSLLGKLIRVTLNKDRQRDLLPDKLPRFPVKQWLQFLVQQGKGMILDVYQRNLEYLQQHTRSLINDAGGNRIVVNYAAMATAWRFLCEFAGIPRDFGSFREDLIAEMNLHIKETEASREPWVAIIELALGEWQRGQYHFPMKVEWDRREGVHDREPLLLMRPKNVMHHLQHTPAMKESYNSLPVKSPRVFKQQLEAAGVIAMDRVDRVVNGHRECHLIALDVRKLESMGIEISYDEDRNEEQAEGVA